MYYGIYKEIRNSSWRCLIDFKINHLPIDVLDIALKSKVHVIRNSHVNVLKPNEYGKSYFDGDTWIIVYDDLRDIPTCRFTIAHELGHFFLGHALVYSRYANEKKPYKKHPAEKQADSFALRLLCPACVLKDLNISSAEDIAKYCRVPIEWAEKRYVRLKALKERDKFFTDPLEREVYDNFNNYLKTVKRKKR
ncbi:MAG: ImmA/IrrE family metallo-endopeptidase [Clostridia bacterium]|nr:ImmA/IrrE family metallo-endopeptidase [Clostridia bacterium]